MKKLFFICSLVLALIMIASSVVHANGAFPWVSDKEDGRQVKVAQVPLPWQFWAILPDGTVIDKIRISPTWLVPPPGLPPGEGPIFVRRQFAVITTPTIPLAELLWGDAPDSNSPTTGPLPGKPIQWTPADSDWVEVAAGQDLDLEIMPPMTAMPDQWEVLVAYEVAVPVTDPSGGSAKEITGRFINEAEVKLLQPTPIPPPPIPPPPVPQIVQVFCNFDLHNNTQIVGINNFELDFANLVFKPQDVLWAIGFIKAHGIPPVPLPQPIPWGANQGSPLVVRPINNGTGTEVKWIQEDKPLVWCDWVHFGLSFNFNWQPNQPNLPITVQGYWTTYWVPPVPELPAVALLTLGLAGIAAFIVVRSKKQTKAA